MLFRFNKLHQVLVLAIPTVMGSATYAGEGIDSGGAAKPQVTESFSVNKDGNVDYKRCSGWLDQTMSCKTTTLLASGSSASNADLETFKTESAMRFSTSENRISNAESSVDSLNTRVGAAESKLTKNTGDIASLSTRIGTSESKITKNAGDIASLGTRIGTSEGKITKNAGDIANLSTRVGETESGVNQNSKNINQLDVRVVQNTNNIAKGINFVADEGMVNAQMGDTIEWLGDKNLHTSFTDKTMTLSVSDNPVFNGQVTAKSLWIKPDGSINFSGNVISNVGAGKFTLDSEEAINGAQLYRIAQNTATHLGGGAMVGTAGEITAPTYLIQNVLLGQKVEHHSVESALQSLDSNTQTHMQDIATHFGGGASIDENGRITQPTYTVVDAKTGKSVEHHNIGSAIQNLNENAKIATQDMASLLGAGATVGADGRLVSPSYQIKDLSSGKLIEHKNIGHAMTALQKNINHTRGESYAGTATAMAVASLGQAFQPNQSTVGLSTGMYNGRVGYALGASYMEESGRFLFKGALSSNSTGYIGATVGATYYFD